MSETITLVLIFIVYSVVREAVYYFQISKLQELLKVNDITEYYTAKKATKNPNANKIEEEENKISINDPRFDITKANKVILDNQEIPINFR